MDKLINKMLNSEAKILNINFQGLQTMGIVGLVLTAISLSAVIIALL